MAAYLRRKQIIISMSTKLYHYIIVTITRYLLIFTTGLQFSRSPHCNYVPMTSQTVGSSKKTPPQKKKKQQQKNQNNNDITTVIIYVVIFTDYQMIFNIYVQTITIMRFCL